MTRQLTVVERFEHGTLLKVEPHPEYADTGTVHAYYVPDRARLEAGRDEVTQMESTEELQDENGVLDSEAIKGLVSATELVERAEETTLNRKGGNVANAKAGSLGFSWGPSSSDRTVVPAGVVKFGDPDADRDDTPIRDPVERGYYWAAVQEQALADSAERRVEYRDDVQQAGVLRARVPMSVVRAGDDLVAAYLAAHDHINPYIAHALKTDRETISDRLEGFTTI